METPKIAPSAQVREAFQRPLVLHGSVYALLVVIHLSLVWCMRYPTSFYDECTYLGFARYFAGVSHVLNLTGGASGHFGYALFLVPAFWLASAFRNQYLLALALNAMLMSTSYLSLYYLLSKMTDLSRRASVAIAFATCLYPSFLLLSTVVASENAFVPVCLLIPVSLLVLFERRTVMAGLFVGVTVGTTYMIHSRGISVLLAAAFLLIVMTALRRLPWYLAIVPLAIVAGAYMLTYRENLHIVQMGYAGAGLPQSSAALVYLKSAPGRYAAFMVLLGEIVYLLQATYCLYFAGWACMVVQAWRLPGRASRPARIAVTVFLLVIGISVAIGAAIFIGPQEPFHRANHLLIGRYNEGVAAVFIAFTLALVWRAASDRNARILLAKCAAAGAATLVALTLLVSPHVQNLAVCSINSLANMPLIRITGGNDLRLVTLAVLAISALLFLVLYYGRQLAVAALGSLFLLSGFYTFMLYYSQRMLPRNVQPVALADAVAKLGTVEAISYEMSAWTAFFYGTYQLELPHTHFVQFHGERGQIPTSPVVIASTAWKDGPRLGYIYVAREPSYDQALWVSSGLRTAARSNPASFLRREVGSAVVPGIRTEGLYPEEGDLSTRFRWTNGTARIDVPLRPDDVAGEIAIDLSAFEKTKSSVWVNGEKVLDTQVGPGLTSTTVLLAKPQKGGTLALEIRSATFMPQPPVRLLGVQVRSVRILSARH